MGKGRSLLLFLFAVLIAIAAAWVANSWLQTQIIEQPPPPTVDVVTPTRPIAANEPISADDVRLSARPAYTVSANALRDDPDWIVGQFTLRDLNPGDELLAEYFVPELEPEPEDPPPPEEPPTLTPPPSIPPTVERQIRVQQVVGTNRTLAPTDRVDVLVARQAAHINQRGSIQTVIQDAEVSRIHPVIAAPHGSPELITQAIDLRVTQQQAELLDLIRNDWHTIVSLRPYRQVVLRVDRVGLPLERGMRIDVIAAPRQGRSVSDVRVLELTAPQQDRWISDVRVLQNAIQHQPLAVQAQTVVENVRIVDVYEQNIRPAPGDSALVTVRYVTLEVNRYQARLLASLHDADEWQVTVSLRP